MGEDFDINTINVFGAESLVHVLFEYKAPVHANLLMVNFFLKKFRLCS